MIKAKNPDYTTGNKLIENIVDGFVMKVL